MVCSKLSRKPLIPVIGERKGVRLVRIFGRNVDDEKMEREDLITVKELCKIMEVSKPLPEKIRKTAG